MKKLVKTLKTNKLLVWQEKLILREKSRQSTENKQTLGIFLICSVLQFLFVFLFVETNEISVCISPNGWAWLVHGRRLVVWRYNRLDNKQHFSANCRELTLPPSDLAHNARLVNVYAANENQTPSCIAVSPEGLVRYWPSIAHSGSSYEINSDLQGQECYSLCNVQPLGSILSTTTSTVVLIYHGSTTGQHAIACRILKPPQGLLGGIGRRVSSLLWGGIPTGSESVSRSIQEIFIF